MLPTARSGTARAFSQPGWRGLLVTVTAAVCAVAVIAFASATPPVRPADSEPGRTQLYAARVTIPGIAGDRDEQALEQVAAPSRFAFPVAEWTQVTDRFGAVRPGGVLHGGIDLGLDGRPQSPVLAACAGEVVEVGYQLGYGNVVTINCGDGWAALVGHLSTSGVYYGQRVAQGEVIGVSGSTGVSTGEHVHFEIRFFGARLNPELFLDFGIPWGTPLSSGPIDPALFGIVEPEATPAESTESTPPEAVDSTETPAGTATTETPTPETPTPVGTPAPTETPAPSSTPTDGATPTASATPEPTVAPSATEATAAATAVPATAEP